MCVKLVKLTGVKVVVQLNSNRNDFNIEHVFEINIVFESNQTIRHFVSQMIAFALTNSKWGFLLWLFNDNEAFKMHLFDNRLFI